MLEKRVFIIHWSCFILAIILIFLTIAQIIAVTYFGQGVSGISPQMVDQAALEVILYFLILPVFTIIYWFIKRAWIFFPWQHNKVKK